MLDMCQMDFEDKTYTLFDI